MSALRLLYVDDNFQDAILFRILLKKISSRLSIQFECDEAENGFDAVGLIRKAQYDLVFLDQQMPDPDGLQTFEYIKQIDWKEGITMPIVVAYSNCDLREFRTRCIHAGMHEFMVKYLSENQLIEILGKYCQIESTPI